MLILNTLLPGVEVTAAALLMQQQHLASMSPPATHLPAWPLQGHAPAPAFAPSTTSAFSIPVKPVASVPLPSGAVYEQLGAPFASAGIRHSSASAFLPASSPLLGPPRQPGPQMLQMAVLQPVALPALQPTGMGSGGVVVAPWPLSHPQPMRPTACTAQQLQELVRGAGVTTLPPSLLASATALSPGGPLYLPSHTAAVEGQAIPLQLAMGLT